MRTPGRANGRSDGDRIRDFTLFEREGGIGQGTVDEVFARHQAHLEHVPGDTKLIREALEIGLADLDCLRRITRLVFVRELDALHFTALGRTEAPLAFLFVDGARLDSVIRCGSARSSGDSASTVAARYSGAR